MINGSFSDFHSLPTVKTSIECNAAISYLEFTLDTGFSGYIKINQEVADDLRIKKLGLRYMNNANGQRVRAGFAYGFAELEGKKKSVEIIVADGPLLLGINFLAAFGYKAIVDCKNWACHLELAP
jgi:predicted aspartyl protease